MSGFPIVDLVVGIIFIYFLLSIICSSVVEIVLTVKRTRATILEQWLLQIFDEKIKIADDKPLEKLGKVIMDHCAVTALTRKGQSPSYIDAKNFVTALLDKVITNSGNKNPATITNLIESFTTTTAISDELKHTFLLYAREADDTINNATTKATGAVELLRSKMENWYDTNMDRITGAMKQQYTRRFTVYVAIVVTILVNADTISISKYLYSNEDAKTSIAAKAYATATDKNVKARIDSLRTRAGDDTAKINTIDELQKSIDTRVNAINTASAALKESIPLGWSKSEFAIDDPGEWVLFILVKIIGIVLTILAIMMGAPFWFDILNKISNLRSTGPKPPSSTDNSNSTAK